MNGGIIPPLLLSASVALMLSVTTGRTALFAIGAMTTMAALVALIALPPVVGTAVFVAVFATMIAAAALTFLPATVAERWSIMLAVAAGAGVGTMASASGNESDLLVALPLSLMFIPGRWIVARGFGLGIKIVASWIIAIALLSTFVSLTPTPGYQPDHME